MALNPQTAVKNAADKTKTAVVAGKGSGVKKADAGLPKAVYVVGGVVLLLIVGMIIIAFSGDKESSQQVEQQTQQEFTDATDSANAQAGVTVYDEKDREIVTQSQTADYSKELVYFTDPSTGMQMVETANGPLLVGSAEGAAYIQDYEAKHAEWKAQNPPVDPNAPTAQANVQQDVLNQTLTAQQARIESLEQEKVNLQSQMEQLSAYSDKQTQTITNLTARVTSMQPVFEHSQKQAQQKVQVTLTGKNRSVEVEAVSGDMAWINHDGKSVPVRVGDYLPGSNVKIKAIDALHNKVILAK